MKKTVAGLLAALGCVGGVFALQGNIPKAGATVVSIRLVADSMYVATAYSIANVPPPNALDSAYFENCTSPVLEPDGSCGRHPFYGPTFPQPQPDTFAYYVGNLAPGTQITGTIGGRAYRGTKASGKTTEQWSYTLPSAPIDTMPPPAPGIAPPTIIGPDSSIGTLPDTMTGWYAMQIWVQPRVLRVMSTIPACLGTTPDWSACRTGIMDSLPTQADRYAQYGCGFVGVVDTGQNWSLYYHATAYPDSAWGNCDGFLALIGRPELSPPLKALKDDIEAGTYLAVLDESPFGGVARWLARR